MAAISVFDAVSVGSGLAFCALFASARPQAATWRRRLTLAFCLVGAALLAGLALFYRPASWVALLAEALEGDGLGAAKFVVASLAGAYAGRRLRRVLDARAAIREGEPAGPAVPLASGDRHSADPPAKPNRANLWNKLLPAPRKRGADRPRSRPRKRGADRPRSRPRERGADPPRSRPRKRGASCSWPRPRRRGAGAA
ncbi:MAG: hypothetical protein HZY79_06195 [Rhodoblastus sp.]|nr:MAG: hypothetical protein HZY79_06195 [Rhodoblastus sp.]